LSALSDNDLQLRLVGNAKLELMEILDQHQVTAWLAVDLRV